MFLKENQIFGIIKQFILFDKAMSFNFYNFNFFIISDAIIGCWMLNSIVCSTKHIMLAWYTLHIHTLHDGLSNDTKSKNFQQTWDVTPSYWNRTVIKNNCSILNCNQPLISAYMHLSRGITALEVPLTTLRTAFEIYVIVPITKKLLVSNIMNSFW